MKYKISVQITCSFSELKLIFIPFAYQHKAWYDHGDSTEKVQRQKHFVNQTETLDLKTYLTFISIYFQLHVAVNDVNWVDHAGMRVPSIALQLPNVRYKPGNKRRMQQQTTHVATNHIKSNFKTQDNNCAPTSVLYDSTYILLYIIC